MSLKNINEAFERKFNEVNDANHEEASILESLRDLLRNLNEAEMSPEDRRESDLIRSAYAKIQKRSNARLSPEEQEVLDKYGIVRDYDKKLHYKSENPRNRDNTAIIDNPEDKTSHGKRVDKGYGRKDGEFQHLGYRKDPKKINYADRARKRPERAKNRSYDYTYTYTNNSWVDDTEYAVDDTGLIDYNDHDDRERSWYDRGDHRGVSQNTAINRMSQSKLAKMRGALGNRKIAQRALDNAKARFDKRKSDADDRFMTQMQDLKKHYDLDMSYANSEYRKDSDPTARNKAQAEIDALLKRKKNESKDLSNKSGSITNILLNNRSWQDATTPKELSKAVKNILDKENVHTKKSEELVKKLSEKKNIIDASFYIYNFINAGSGDALIK